MRTPIGLLAGMIVVSAAALAADLGHGIISALAGSRIVASQYASYYHGVVTPVLLGALVCTGLFAAAVFGGSLAKAAGLQGDWLEACAGRLGRLHVLALVPVVFAVQLTLLVAMESAEQIVALGHPLGLSASLGAAAPVALIVHALAALVLGTLTVLFARALARATSVLARAAGLTHRRLAVDPQPQPPVAQLARAGARFSARRLPPLARRIANRPPPFSASAA